MRKDENGQPCPSTLGEYRDICAALSPYREKCKAVKFLDEKIAKDGRDEEVLAVDSQMRMLLMPMIIES